MRDARAAVSDGPTLARAHAETPAPAIGVSGARAPSGLVLLFKGQLNGAKCWVLLDTGASYSFVDDEWARRIQLRRSPLPSPLAVLTANSQSVSISEQGTGELHFGGSRTSVALKPIENLMHGVHIVLGNDWLTQHSAVLDLQTGECRVCVRGESHVLRARRRQVTAAASVGRFAALSPHQGVLLSAKQAAKALKRGCAAWLVLVQRDDGVPPDAGAFGLAAAAPGESGPHVPTPEQRARFEKLLKEFESLAAPISGLPPQRPVGHTINLVPGMPPPYRRAYRLSPAERAEVERQVAELLRLGFIEPSASPYGAPILFVHKPDQTLRMCCDFRALNKITVRDRYPLPRIDDLLDQVGGCRVFSSLDLQQGYHQVLIPEEDRAKTAFVTHLGQFQYKVLCFGLTNAPATFQRLMERVLGNRIGRYVLVYLDDILVMSRTVEEHLVHLRDVLTVLRANRFHIKLSKCEWLQSTLKFLGFIVGNGEVRADPAKLRVLADWQPPGSLAELRRFLGLANYFRRFIPRYSLLVAPLTDLTSVKRASEFKWDAWPAPLVRVFNRVKQALVSPPVLALPDWDKLFSLEADASLHGSGAVLLQEGRVVAYDSYKFSPAESKYTTTEKEMLALVRALKVWRCYLEGRPVELVTDHHPLTYVNSQELLSRRVARWVLFLQQFDFVVKYRRGKDNAVADALGRLPSLAAAIALLDCCEPEGGEPARRAARREFLHEQACAVALLVGSLSAVVTRAGARAQVQQQQAEAEVAPQVADQGQSAQAGSEQSGSRSGSVHSEVSSRRELPRLTRRVRPPVRAPVPAPPVPVQGFPALTPPTRAATPVPPVPVVELPRLLPPTTVERDPPAAPIPRESPERAGVEGAEEHVDVVLAPQQPVPQGAADLPAPEQGAPVALVDAIRQAYAQDPLFEDREFVSQLEEEDGLWLDAQRKVLVPGVPELRQRVIAEHHDTPYSGHRGVEKTIELVSRHFAWATLKQDVEAYVRSCDACQRHKSSTQRPAGLVQPLPVPRRPWERIGVDLWVKLPRSPRGHDSVLVVTCHFSKYVRLLPVSESLTAEGLWAELEREVFSLYGWPREMVSDRGPQFTSAYTQQMCALRRVKQSLSSAYHPQSNGQTERVNRVLGEVMRTCVSNASDADWDQHLHMVQFAMNNSWRQSLGTTPHFLLFGQHPRTPAVCDVPVQVPSAESLVRRHAAVLQRARQLLADARERMAVQLNRHRRDVSYKPGELVLLSTANLALQGVRKLMPRYVGPFVVEGVVNDAAVELRLPPGYARMHKVFHVSLLKHYHARGGVVPAPPPPVRVVDGVPEWEVDRIIEHRAEPRQVGRGVNRRTVSVITQYRVHWKDWPETYVSWEPVKNVLPGAADLVAEYRAAHNIAGDDYMHADGL